MQGEDESSARDVSKRLRRRNGRESDIIGLVGTGVGVWGCGGSSSGDRLSSVGEAKSQGGDWSSSLGTKSSSVLMSLTRV